MTAEEIATEVVAQQGWLVVGSSDPYKVGDSITNPFTHMVRREQILVALRVIGTGTKEEFVKQAALARTMSGMEPTGDPHWAYYYRTVPQD